MQERYKGKFKLLKGRSYIDCGEAVEMLGQLINYYELGFREFVEVGLRHNLNAYMYAGYVDWEAVDIRTGEKVYFPDGFQEVFEGLEYVTGYEGDSEHPGGAIYHVDLDPGVQIIGRGLTVDGQPVEWTLSKKFAENPPNIPLSFKPADIQELADVINGVEKQGDATEILHMHLHNTQMHLEQLQFENRDMRCRMQTAQMESIKAEKEAQDSRVWDVRPSKREQTYTPALGRALRHFINKGHPAPPTAREVLEYWRGTKEQHLELYQVLADGANYYDSKGDVKALSLDSLSKAIARRVVCPL